MKKGFRFIQAAFLCIMGEKGKVVNRRRVQKMVAQMDREGFGMCPNAYACKAECPEEITVENMALLNRWYTGSAFSSERTVRETYAVQSPNRSRSSSDET